MNCKIKYKKIICHTADPGKVQPHDCWDREFESGWGQGYRLLWLLRK